MHERTRGCGNGKEGSEQKIARKSSERGSARVVGDAAAISIACLILVIHACAWTRASAPILTRFQHTMHHHARCGRPHRRLHALCNKALFVCFTHNPQKKHTQVVCVTNTHRQVLNTHLKLSSDHVHSQSILIECWWWALELILLGVSVSDRQIVRFSVFIFTF